MLRLAQIWKDFHQTRLSAVRLGDILNTVLEASTIQARRHFPATRGDIVFDRATFRYRIDGPEVLHDMSFRVPAGQIVGLSDRSNFWDAPTGPPDTNHHWIKLWGRLNNIPRLGYCAGVRSDAH